MSSEGLLQLEIKLQKAIDDVALNCTKQIKELDEKIVEKLSSKVSWKLFTLMVGFLVSLFIGISTLLYVEVKETRQVATDTREGQVVDAANISNIKEGLSDIKRILGSAEITK
jgi:hypothetical protein